MTGELLPTDFTMHYTEEFESDMLEYQAIMVKAYLRHNKVMWSINHCLQIFNIEMKNGKDWRIPSLHRSKRRPLTKDEKDRICFLIREIKKIEVSYQLRYHINRL